MEKSQLKEKLAADLKAALKLRDARKISVLRMLQSEIHNQEIATRKDATDADVLKALSSSAKKHQDSISQFLEGGRLDLVETERGELEIIHTYLPAPLSDQEISSLIDEAIKEAEAKVASDFGKVMRVLMPKIGSRANGQIISQKLKEKLS